MMLDSEKALPSRVLKWVIDSIDPSATIESVRHLQGSTSSVLHCIAVKSRGRVRDFVLRQFDNVEWLSVEPDLARHEAESLIGASRTGIPTPQVVAFDETGSDCGVPAVLMTRLEGSVVLRPQNLQHWLNGLAESLAQIHLVDGEDFAWKYFTYMDLQQSQQQTWSKYPQEWNLVFDYVRRERPVVKECFIHRDYHPANVLWKDNRVSGVVDWVNACQGPAGIDIGHCRVNLAQLFDVTTADAFLSAYQRHAGAAFSHDPYWDFISCIDVLFGPPSVYPGWAAFGVSDLTNGMMMERMDAYMLSLLARL